jgi:fatty acid desaturase
MSVELAPSVADDSTLPRFAVPSSIRQWGAREKVAERNANRANRMLLGTLVGYAALIAVGEYVDHFAVWLLVWVGLVAGMMRIDAIHHEAVHRSLYNNRFANDVVASVTGALEGFHAAQYRCFHLAHHSLTRRDGDPSDPEAFYDEVLTRPATVGPLRVPARVVYVLGNLLGGLPFALQLIVSAVSTMVGRPPAYVRAASLERHVRRWGWVPFALWALAIGGSIGLGHGAELVRWWVVPMVAFLCGPYTFFAVPEHYRAQRGGQMVSSTGSVRSNAIYRWVTLDGNFHLAHHVFPTASWWRLRDADAQLASECPSELRYSGYLTFHRQVWRDMSRSADPV